jgi:hypothetical protein
MRQIDRRFVAHPATSSGLLFLMIVDVEEKSSHSTIRPATRPLVSGLGGIPGGGALAEC